MNLQTQHEGELIAMADKGRILLLSFRTEGKDITPSIFKDHAPKLEIGKRYVFTTEEKIYQGKTYLNLKTKYRGKDSVGYYIEERGGASPIGQQVGNTNHPPPPSKDPREEYWANREKNDVIRDLRMQRGGYSHDAAVIVAAMINSWFKPPNHIPLDPIGMVAEFTDALMEAAKKKEASP